MNRYSSLTWLVPVIILLATITSCVGLFVSGGKGPYTFTSTHGVAVEMYGKGIYQYDSLMAGAGFRGTDAVVLAVGIPFLLLAHVLASRGSKNGQILRIGALFFFLYNGASMTFSAAFNPLFLVYTALFSTSLFATIVALTTFDLPNLPQRVQAGFPHRGLAIFLFIAGICTFLLWVSELVGPLLSGAAPAMLGPYTTMYTHGFDSAVISPAAVLIGIFVLQRKPLGYLLSAPILILCALVGIVVIGQTISQTLAGITFPIGVYIGMVGSWIIMGAFAVGLTLAYFKNLSWTQVK